MEKTLKFAFGFIVFSVMIFLVAPLSALAGALSGWIVSLFFDTTFHEVMKAFGIPAIPLWKLGATLGYFSGFLRTMTTVSK